MLDLAFRNSTKSKAWGPAFFTRLLQRAIRITKVSVPHIEVSVTLVGPARIRVLNKKYRHKDTPTDVLSFPLYEPLGNRYTEGVLGDIVICVSECVRQAQQQNISVKEYMAWATVHGFLHLLGYDHEQSPKKAKQMVTLERRILTTQ